MKMKVNDPILSYKRKGGPKEMGDPLQKQQSHTVTGRAPKQSDTAKASPRAKSEASTDAAAAKSGMAPSQMKAMFKKGRE